jgi:enoyl-CoA hydratase
MQPRGGLDRPSCAWLQTVTIGTGEARTTVYETIEYEVADNVATIWLNRPESRNALNETMFAELGQAARVAASDDEVHVVLVRGRGKAFCAGGDLGMLRKSVEQVPTSLSITKNAAHTFALLYEMPKPTICVVHGHAVAGGFELMISSDFVVALEDAKIGDFHMRRALLGGAGPIYRLPRIVGMRRAKEIILTGKLMSGTRAEALGLVNVTATEETLEDVLDDFVESLKVMSPAAMSITKMALNRGLDADTSTLMTLEHFACSLLHQTDDAREGMEAFLEKRDPVWSGS